MKVLIATDLLISYLQKRDYVDGLDLLFQWLRTLKYKWYTDISSITILTHFFTIDKLSALNSFSILKGVPPKSDKLQLLKEQIKFINEDKKTNLISLIPQLSWLNNGDVDFLITENDNLRSLAKIIGLEGRTYSLEGFISKCSIEHRDVDFNKGIYVQIEKMKELSLSDKFFKTFIDEYSPYYKTWFHKKGNDDVYVSKDNKGKIKALLKLKIETRKEDYSDISPEMKPAKRLKISSFKVDYTGHKLGERFLHIIFDTAIKEKVDEIYVTIFDNSSLRRKLINMISQWGFRFFGYKNGKECVYVRSMHNFNFQNPREYFPYVKFNNTAFIVPVHHEYAKDLVPSISLDADKKDVEPYKCSIKKMVTLYNDDNNLKVGSILLFYRMEKKIDKRGIIAIGTVENIHRNIENEKQFLLYSRKRSALDNEQLSGCWRRSDYKIIIADFLYNYSFGNHIIPITRLEDNGIELTDIHHQQLIPINESQYRAIIKGTYYEKNIDIN